MAFDLSQYETVEERLEKWWKENEDGSIQTELVNRPNANPDEFVFVARLYRTTADAVPVATGWASEIRTGSSFNKFACELAESSAIGRALANYIYSKKGARPSRTEMERVSNYSPPGTRARAVENVLLTQRGPCFSRHSNIFESNHGDLHIAQNLSRLFSLQITCRSPL